MKLRIKNTEFTLKLIGWIQIIGGVTGLGLICKLLLYTDAINGPILLIFLVGISLFIFSIYAGIKMLKSLTEKISIILVLINQILQLVQWSILGYSFSYSSGAELMIGIKGLSISFNFAAIVSTFSMSINSSNLFFIKINLISVVVITVLLDILKDIKKPYKLAGSSSPDTA